MRTIFLGAAAAAGLSVLTVGVLQAQDAPPALPGQMDVGRVEAGTYTADSAHSLVGWRVNHLGFNDYFGIFGDVAGTLTIDPAAPESAKVDVTIPVASVLTASEILTGHLLRPAAEEGGKPDFFGPAPAPARFVSTAVETTGGTSATITGDLTLNGVTRPVTVSAEFTGAGTSPVNQAKTIGFEGRATINRSDFGVSYGIPMISDEVALDITVAFEKQ